MNATKAPSVHLRTCPLCEAMCGLEVSVRGDRVVGIRPDLKDVYGIDLCRRQSRPYG